MIPRENKQMMDETIAMLLDIISHPGTINQNHNKIALHIYRMAIIERHIVTCVGKDMGKMEPSTLLVGM